MALEKEWQTIFGAEGASFLNSCFQEINVTGAIIAIALTSMSPIIILQAFWFKATESRSPSRGPLSSEQMRCIALTGCQPSNSSGISNYSTGCPQRAAQKVAAPTCDPWADRPQSSRQRKLQSRKAQKAFAASNLGPGWQPVA